MHKLAASTVLLVEDYAAVRAVARMMLSEAGYTVLEAANASEALDVLERHPEVVLLFTDVVLPGMSGFDLAHLAKRMRPGLSVVYSSGSLREPPLGEHGFGHGPLICKPWKRDQIVDVIRKAMSGPA